MPPNPPPSTLFFYLIYPCIGNRFLRARPDPELCPPLQGCSSPLVVKFADTQRDKEQRRLQQQLVQQIQQLNSASTWGNLTGLGTLTPQYLAVSYARRRLRRVVSLSVASSVSGLVCEVMQNRWKELWKRIVKHFFNFVFHVSCTKHESTSV